ncbi:MAG: carbohydrate ABC transporter permease [Oscillospiraceae bacterium]|nr:carbohydrate ABC transporter permease [Oscillospiraceae bacterium]
MRKKRDVLERRRTIGERIFFIITFLVLAIWSIIVLCMFLWALMNVFKTNIDYLREPLALPKLSDLQWENFKLAIDKLEYNGHGFWDMLFNSVWLVGGTALLQSFSVCVTGYIFAQYEFKGREFLFKTVLFIMIIPIYGALPASYKLIYGLGINDSPLYLISQIGGFSANMMITYGFFKGVPRAYREAVYIDGGSDFKAFTTIGLPMGKNILIAYFLLNFITQWNNYETPLLYFNNMPTLSLGLHAFQQEIQYAANYPAYFAGALIAMLPILLIFIFFADKLMGQMYSGGLKG